MGTFGVLTGNIGEFVLERDPKNLDGFSGLALGVDSNLALPLATAPAKKNKKFEFPENVLIDTLTACLIYLLEC